MDSLTPSHRIDARIVNKNLTKPFLDPSEMRARSWTDRAVGVIANLNWRAYGMLLVLIVVGIIFQF